MAKNNNGLTKTKKTWIMILALLVVVCIGINGWWFYIYKFGADKVISNTINVGLQTSADGATKYLHELNYFKNKNKNGYEAFEIKLNYLRDENKEGFYSQGIQYITDSPSKNITFDYYEDADSPIKKDADRHKTGWYNIEDYYNHLGTYRANKNSVSQFNYSSSDDYKTTINSTNPVSLETKIKLDLGESGMFLMGFKGYDTPLTNSNFQYKTKGSYNFYGVFGVQDYHYYYAYYDINYLIKLMFNAVQSLPAGTNKACIFEFGDLFNYYEPTEEENKYSDIALKGNDEEKIITDTKSYYSVKVNISDDGIQKASDSIFNCVKGSQNFSTGVNTDDTYFIGRSIINVSYKNFDFIKLSDNVIALKLKEDFKNYYIKYKEKIVLDVQIDIEEIKALGYEFFGFAKDSGLKNFNIKSCVKISLEKDPDEVLALQTRYNTGEISFDEYNSLFQALPLKIIKSEVAI